MSYGYCYEEFIDLTPNQLLQKVKQEQIFELVLGEEIHTSSRYRSPFREDTHPDCRFEQREDGTILWVDFGDNPQHRSCFRMVMDYYKVDLRGAIRLICTKLGLSTSSTDYKPEISNIRLEVHGESRAEISYDAREYDRRDIRFWAGTITSIDNLREDSVYSVKRARINNPSRRKSFSFSPYGLCYAIDFIDAVKLYQPHTTKYRFISNCTSDHIGNIDNIPATGDKLIIAKAYKDHRVFRNLSLGASYSVIWLQNEGCIPSIHILTNLVDRFRSIIIFFDNDVAGVLASIKLAEILNGIRAGCAIIKRIPFVLPQKDIGEFILREGRNDTIKLLNQIKL